MQSPLVHLLVAPWLAMLASCAAQRPAPVPVVPLPSPPLRFAPVLEPGCLLPRPELLLQAPSRQATMALDVDETGRVVAASLHASTGLSELDSALKAAVLLCRLAPAYVLEGQPRVRRNVAEKHELTVTWPATGPLVGPQRCFTPDYPHAARRAEETGRVVVLFRKSSASGQAEVQVRPGSVGFRSLRSLSTRTVSDCLAHDEVSATLPVDQWISVAYDWRLE
ncbi:MAG: hypothetical protein HY856_10675 [Burkholderiales bacterium]|nr:hypothetical protein [Burkholderiales bacterium]